MTTNGESRAPVLATSPHLLLGSVISSQSPQHTKEREVSGGRKQRESCVCWGQSVLLSLNHRRNHQLCRTPPAVAHHWGPDLGPGQALGETPSSVCCLPLDRPTCSSPRAQRQEQEADRFFFVSVCASVPGIHGSNQVQYSP